MNVARPQAQSLPTNQASQLAGHMGNHVASRQHEGTAGSSEGIEASATDPSNLGDALPACCLLAIISGFAAFVAFGQAVAPGIIAAVIGAIFGLLFVNEHPESSQSSTTRRMRKTRGYIANR